jgi:hypothetical protein
MLIRVNNQILNTEAMATAKLSVGITGLGIPGSGVGQTLTLTITFIGGSEATIESGAAQEAWDFLCTDLKKMIDTEA